jgi:hypothetical protein
VLDKQAVASPNSSLAKEELSKESSSSSSSSSSSESSSSSDSDDSDSDNDNDADDVSGSATKVKAGASKRSSSQQQQGQAIKNCQSPALDKSPEQERINALAGGHSVEKIKANGHAGGVEVKKTRAEEKAAALELEEKKKAEQLDEAERKRVAEKAAKEEEIRKKREEAEKKKAAAVKAKEEEAALKQAERAKMVAMAKKRQEDKVNARRGVGKTKADPAGYLSDNTGAIRAWARSMQNSNGNKQRSSSAPGADRAAKSPTGTKAPVVSPSSSDDSSSDSSSSSSDSDSDYSSDRANGDAAVVEKKSSLVDAAVGPVATDQSISRARTANRCSHPQPRESALSPAASPSQSTLVTSSRETVAASHASSKGKHSTPSTSSALRSASPNNARVPGAKRGLGKLIGVRIQSSPNGSRSLGRQRLAPTGVKNSLEKADASGSRTVLRSAATALGGETAASPNSSLAKEELSKESSSSSSSSSSSESSSSSDSDDSDNDDQESALLK